MILPIKHTLYWELMRQKNKDQINKFNTHKNLRRVDYVYTVGDKAMLSNKNV